MTKWLLFSGLLILLLSCQKAENNSPARDGIKANKPNYSVYIQLNREIYRQTVYGEAPQIALWWEGPSDNKIQTIKVTRRSAKGRWVGKIECPGSLPLWFSRFKIEYSTASLPKRSRPLADGFTSATPKEKWQFACFLPENENIKLFIEGNVSGDFNRFFPSHDRFGVPDMEGIGQPSIIYRAIFKEGKRFNPDFELLGFICRQKDSVWIDQDLRQISTAKELIKSIQLKPL